MNRTTPGDGVSWGLGIEEKIQKSVGGGYGRWGEGGVYLIPSPQDTDELPAIAEGDK